MNENDRDDGGRLGGEDWCDSFVLEDYIEQLQAENVRLRAIVQRAREDLGPHPRCTDCGAYQHELRELYLAADKALQPNGATQCETESS